MTKISALPAGVTPTGTEKVPAVQGGATVGLTLSQIGLAPTFTQNGTGAVARSFDAKFRDVIFAKDYGVKADVITQSATVSITSGTKNLTATGAGFVVGDIGKTIFVQSAGTAGAYLQSTITGVTDAAHITINDNAVTTVSAAVKSLIYGTDDGAAILAAITAARNGPYTLWFTDGVMFHSTLQNWAYNSLHVKFFSDDVSFIFTGAGATAHQFSGILNYPASQGCVGGFFGLPGIPIMRGNPTGSTTNALLVDNYHFGVIAARGRDAVRGFFAQDTGIVGGSAVSTVLYLRTSNNSDGPFILQPNAGINASKLIACTLHNPIIEGCGNNASIAVQFLSCINNTVISGTFESNSAGGFLEDSSCSRNTYINLDVETNGTGRDWNLNGKYPVLVNCAGAGTTSGNLFGSTSASLWGGKFQSLTNNDDTLWSNATEFVTAFTDNAIHSTILNPISAIGVTAKENATSVPGNKTINTANAITLKINSKQVTDLSGTGTIIPTTVSPAFTTPSLGVATATSVNGNTITAGSGVLTLGAGKTATVSNTLTFTATDGSTAAFGAGGTMFSTSNGVLNAAPANPTGTASATALMMGLGVATCRFAPVNSTRVEFIISGTISNATLGSGATFRMSYGTGAGPANAAALTGTAFGSAAVNAVGGGGGAAMFLPFTAVGIATGLTPGTTYWFDIQLAATISGTASIQSLTATAKEV